MGNGDWGLGPIPNPHYLINKQFFFIKKINYLIILYIFLNSKKFIFKYGLYNFKISSFILLCQRFKQ